MKNILIIALAIAIVSPTMARDHGQFAASSPERKAWFQGLRSGKGPCCADADGNVVLDADWESKDGHYRVRINNEWIDVPEDAVIKEPNLDGRTIVWPMWTSYNYGGAVEQVKIRCFMPGVMM